MIGQVFTDYSFTHYPQWHWVEGVVPPEPQPEIPTIIGRKKRAFSIASVGGANADVYTGIQPIDVSLKGLYKVMGDLAGD